MTSISKEEDEKLTWNQRHERYEEELLGFPWELGTVRSYNRSERLVMIRDRFDFFRRNQEVLLGEASREDELKQISQFQNEDQVQVIVAHNFQTRIIDM